MAGNTDGRCSRSKVTETRSNKLCALGLSSVVISTAALFLILPIILVSPAWAEGQVSRYFSDTYQEARTKFISAAEAAGGSLEKYRNPYIGAENEELYVDVATFNLPQAKNILVLGSGTHGIEGFAGSCIQVGLLAEGIAKDLPEDVGLLFYHALNPFGFSHLRRFNEDNIDLNRNFVDHDNPYPSNKGYDVLALLIEPINLGRLQDIKAKLLIAWYRLTKGELWLQTAVSQGQYKHPNGLFFGGNKATWSNQVIQRIIERHLSTASHVILIDFHTGLGEYGQAEVIAEVEQGSDSHERMVKWWGDKVKIPLTGKSVSPPVMGTLKRGFAHLLPSADLTAVTLEFGTYPLSEVLWVLRSENYLHHHAGEKGLDSLEIKAEFKRVFYPDKNDWKQAVWQQGREVVQQAHENIH